MEGVMDVKPGYKQTEVGVIPEDWEAVPIESLTPPNRKNGIVDGPFGSNLKTIHYRTSGIPIITSGYVTDGMFRADHYLYVDRSKFLEEKRSSVHPGDIVMAKIGERCGASAILPATHETGILSGNALKITVDEARHSTSYVWQVLWGFHVSGKLEVLRTVGAQPALSIANLKRFKIPVPSTNAEQRAIATALGDVDALLAGLDRLIAKKRDLKQAAMQQLLTGQTRLPGFSGEWEVKRLGEIAVIVSGGTPRTSEPTYWNGGIKWCTPTDITRHAGKYLAETERTISHSGLNNSGAVLLPIGTLLLCSRATIGELKIAAEPVCTNQGFKSLVCRPGTSNELLYYKLLTMKQQMVERAFGSTFLEISTRNVSALEVAAPPIDEQAAIAAVLSDMDAELAALEARRDKTRALKQGMMQELLTGRTRLV